MSVRGIRKQDSIYSRLKKVIPGLLIGAEYSTLWLAAKCNVNPNSVYTPIKELEKEGLLKFKKRFGKVEILRPKVELITVAVGAKYSELWDYLHNECNFIALEGQMDDIVDIVKRNHL